MQILSQQQAESIIDVFLGDHGETISKEQFTDVMLSYFENIPGFETVGPARAITLTNRLWGIYMLKNQNAETTATVPITNSSEPAFVDLAKPAVKKAIAEGSNLIKDGKTKADAARAMYALISGESKETIIAAFVEGATLTPKGAQTYWYNCKRRASKEKKTA